MYKIGEFAKVVQTSIRTLRFYDKIDLFKPEEIDLFTNYRYYSDKQIDDFNLINKLKMVGFSLDEIKQNWNNFNDRVLLKKKQELMESRKYLNNQIRNIDLMRQEINETETVKVLRKE